MTWCDLLLSRPVASEFGSKLVDALNSTESRPASKLVVRLSPVGVRRFEGWRHLSINETLDACCAIEGDMWIQKVERFTVDGRMYLGHSRKDAAHMLWRQRNPEKARANSRLQAARTKARMRVEWAEYCDAYLQRFPGTNPVGFDRWSRTMRSAWLEHGPAGVQINDAKGMADQIARDRLNSERRPA